MNKLTSSHYQQKNLLMCLLFIIVVLFCWWSNPDLEPKISPDSYGYIGIALSFQDASSNIRPFFYSLIIKMVELFTGENWQTGLMLFQIILHAIITIILFHLYCKIDISLLISFLLFDRL